MIKVCSFSGCGKEYEALRGNSEYCSGKCRTRAWKATKALQGQAPPHETLQETPPKTLTETPSMNLPTPPTALDPLSQFMVDTLRGQIDEHKQAFAKLNDKYEALLKEKTDLEKQIIELQKSVDAKPGKLEGFAQSDTGKLVIDKLLDHIGPGLGKLVEKISDDKLNRIPNGAQFVEWLAKLPPQYQHEFMSMVNNLANTNEKFADNLANINRMLMGALPQAQAPTAPPLQQSPRIGR